MTPGCVFRPLCNILTASLLDETEEVKRLKGHNKYAYIPSYISIS